MRIGNYRLDVAASGFKTAVQTHVVVDVSARVPHDFKLQPGAVSETVEVSASAPVLQSQDASVGQVVDQRTVDDIPLNGQYYYAMSLWKRKRAQDPTLDLYRIEGLLERATTLDTKLAEPHLQLGNLYSDQARYADAIPEYLKATENNRNLADAHYRLGQAYVHTGQKDKAQEQFQVYQQLRAQHLADLDKQIADIRQFVYSEKDQASAKP